MESDCLRELFDSLTQDFTSFLGYPERPDFSKNGVTWINNFYKSPIFRHVHIEFYKTNRINVIHVNAFPNATIDVPILGLDLIKIGDKCTGFFFDITPINANQTLQKSLIQFKNTIKSPTRTLPEWADFFGENFICITPEQDELQYLLTTARAITREYLNYTNNLVEKYKTNIEKQNKYCIGQKKNDKTFKALAADVGLETAKTFLNDYMFPEIS